jgi:hypothetical protein
MGGGVNAIKPTLSVPSMTSPSGALAVMVLVTMVDGGKRVSLVFRLKTLELTCGNAGPLQLAVPDKSRPGTSNGVCVTCDRNASP